MIGITITTIMIIVTVTTIRATLDRKSHKLLTMKEMHHSQSDAGRLYIPRKKRGDYRVSGASCETGNTSVHR